MTAPQPRKRFSFTPVGAVHKASIAPVNSRTGERAANSVRATLAGRERSEAPYVNAEVNAGTSNAALASQRIRQRMVERLQASGIKDTHVLNAMGAIPRHLFVEEGLAAQAYQEIALTIGYGQTISKPFVVARMLELIVAGRNSPKASLKMLEIGTGCGYQAAVLSHLAQEVYSIERIKPLLERAKNNLRALRIPNLRLHYGDGRLGLACAAPFDAIVVAAAGLEMPSALLDQLKIGGRCIAPIGSEEQVLTLIERTSERQWRESQLDPVFFVPLKFGVI